MDTGTFYATTSAVSFTLLGFWWVVVQFRHDEMTQDPGRRRLAFVVSLHFILPGLMSLGALLTADAPLDLAADVRHGRDRRHDRGGDRLAGGQGADRRDRRASDATNGSRCRCT